MEQLICSHGGEEEVLPCGDLFVVVLWRGLQDVDGHGVARVLSKAEDLWAHQGVLNEGQLWTEGELDQRLMGGFTLTSSHRLAETLLSSVGPVSSFINGQT